MPEDKGFYTGFGKLLKKTIIKVKRHGYLYEKIISMDNLYLASKKAGRGKRRYPEIIKWNKNLQQNIQSLHVDLLNGSYKVSEYSVFTIYEGKERLISKLPFRDRVVHHAILNYLEPIFVNSFIAQSYSCIKRRGIHKCLRDLNKALRCKEDTIYCLKLDIHKFYPSIDHTILKQLLRRKFKDEKLLHLLSNIIDSYPGVPLGNFTSQWFGNFYLNRLDHWIKETKRVKNYFRYCDDIVILHSNKAFLHKLRKEIQQYLFSILKLILPNYQVFPVEKRGIDFLGYKSFHSHIFLRKSIKKRFKRMLLKYPNQHSINSYRGWTLHANCRNLERKLLNII